MKQPAKRWIVWVRDDKGWRKLATFENVNHFWFGSAKREALFYSKYLNSYHIWPNPNAKVLPEGKKP